MNKTVSQKTLAFILIFLVGATSGIIIEESGSKPLDVVKTNLVSRWKHGGFTPTQPDVTYKVTFVSFTNANIPEQDVYLEDPSDKTQVVRVARATSSDPAVASQQIYAAAKFIGHDPFKLGKTPLGPFPKGLKLGMTMHDWLSASGNGTVTLSTGKSAMDLTFQHLIPNGTYTLWCSRVTPPPHPAALDQTCGKADGSENVFHADSQGNARVMKKFSAAILPSSTETNTIIGLAYHSDGKTCGGSPCEFGKNSHVQLITPLPKQFK